MSDSQGFPLKEVEQEIAEQAAEVPTVDHAASERPAISNTAELPAAPPQTFGRYAVVGTLGTGGFGVVYRGYDPELKRDVAIKVPLPGRVAEPADAEAYLTEARVLASLDHPGIVPVHDVGRTPDGLCYVVSKFIAGGNLAQVIAHKRPGHEPSAELAAQVAEALHHAHQRGLVHRDIKPANILLDEQQRPLVADFGLAISDRDFGRGASYCGTPAYMSPEQARGEGHRVDARSDVYSLGVVFYELLTGRRPYRTSASPEILDEITRGDLRPPRQHDHAIPKELERICLKALAARAADRYTTAYDLADDLRHWSARRKRVAGVESASPQKHDGLRLEDATLTTSTRPTSDSALPTPPSAEPARVVPKGLRSFDADDADFFLQLLPGPTDREGLPESLRFWKRRVEATDADATFGVGLLYGPSGCGKSSLVKAGLLPRLAPHVRSVYLEATLDDTEARLLKGLRKQCPNLPAGDLIETVSALRHGQGLATGEKVLIVLDQFEQWLHAHRGEEQSELVRALRHCDGGRVQCVVMIRDDFWLAASRFLHELEIPLDGENCALVDLFDLRHARKVLALFGRALGCLPEVGDISRENEQFLEQAAAGLAEDGKVVSVRLALFAEMVKGKPWTPATLKAVGGTQGVGVTFLEETFAASTAPPQHRVHRKAAQAVLKALLPEAATDIKGHMRSQRELLEVSGYSSRPADFDNLLRILDSELRLITPTEPEAEDVAGGEWRVAGKNGNEEGNVAGAVEGRVTSLPLSKGESEGVEGKVVNGGPRVMCDEGENSTSSFLPATRHAPPATQFFQLTHDYLVPSLRDWLTRKQRETRRGRAELRLAERAAAWNTKPDARHLPSWWEWPNILLFTTRGKWSAPERRIMRSAGRHHAVRFAGLFAMLLAASVVGFEFWRRAEQRRAETLADNVFTASADGVPYALENLRPSGQLAIGRLRERLADPKADAVQRLHAAYALAALGEAPQAFLLDSIPSAPGAECENLVEALKGTKASALSELGRRANEANDATLKARYAIVALHLGDPRSADVSLALRSDPIHRTTLIHAYADWHGDLAVVADLLEQHDDADFRSGLCAALGTIPPEELDPEERQAASRALSQLYVGAPDGGTHSAAGWALRQWKHELPAIVTASRPPTGREWYVNGQGQTMIQLPAGTFSMGTLGESNEPPHEVRLTRAFCLSDREVTVEQFMRFVDDDQYPATEKPADWKQTYELWKQYSPTPDGPVHSVNWFDAVLYCNWLSAKEGIRPAYTRTGKEKLKDYQDQEHEVDAWRCDFTSDGYRLPTDAEWEYACRALTTTSFCFGNDEDLITQYGWIVSNSKSRTWPGGLKLPNGWGLFDMHGNVWEWCYDRFGNYPPADSKPIEDPLGAESSNGSNSNRVLRGGAFTNGPSLARSALRFVNHPGSRHLLYGFRPARTYP